MNDMDDVRQPVPSGSNRFVHQLRRFIRSRNMAWSTEKLYVHWIKRFIHFHNRRHPEGMGEVEIDRFLSDLAVSREVSPSTQATALNALVFLYRQFYGREDLQLDFHRARPHRRVPEVFSHEEALAIIGHISGTAQLMAKFRLSAARFPG